MSNFFAHRAKLEHEVETLIYVAPQGGALLIAAVAANTDEHNSYVSLYVREPQATPVDFYLLKDGAVPEGASLGMLAGKIALNEDDEVYASATATTPDLASIDVYISVLE